jgi:hypothetical protein
MSFLPSTRDVSRVTLAAFLLPAGSAQPILSNLSLRLRPPSLDLALEKTQNVIRLLCIVYINI